VAANPECQKRVKEGVAKVTLLRKICELNANSSVRAKATDLQFGMRARMDNADMGAELKKNSQKGTWPGSRDPVNFSALNGNTFKKAKIPDTNFKFGMLAPRENLDMTPKKNSRKRGVARVTGPLIFGR